MGTLYVSDETVTDYAVEYGSVEAAKEKMQEVIEENRPEGGDDA